MGSSEGTWLAVCLRELDLPGSPWKEVAELVAKRLADRIRIEGLTYAQLTKVSKFVGSDFIKTYKLYESVKRVDDSNVEFQRFKTDADVQTFLKTLTISAAKDAECPLYVNKSSTDCHEKFKDLAKGIFLTHLKDEQSKFKPKSAGYYDIPCLENTQVCDSMIVEMLQSDPGQLSKVIERLKGRLLPSSLRRYLYSLLLLKMRKKSSNSTRQSSTEDDLTQQKIREKFAEKVKEGIAELKIRSATKSPVSGLIESSVVEVMQLSLGLKEVADNIQLKKESCKVLNILYTKRRKFEHYYVYWLVLIQVAMQQTHTQEHHNYELAMWLDIVISEVIPQWPVINSIALSVWDKLAGADGIFGKDVKTHIWALKISNNPAEVKHNLEADDHFHRSQTSSEISGEKKLLHPACYIRNWIMHLFVGHLPLDASLFLWDQLFLENWTKQCIEDCCLVIVSCILEDILQCNDRPSLQHVFYDNLSNLDLIYVKSMWDQLKATTTN